MTDSTIDEFGLIGDLRSAALISKKGTLAWLCWPMFDSEACFAGLLGKEEHGVWSLSPEKIRSVKRRYIPGTLIIETVYTQSTGVVASVTDFMMTGGKNSCLVRIVRGLAGSCRMKTVFSPRFDYGTARPRIDASVKNCWNAVSGPHRLTLQSDVSFHCGDGRLSAVWTARKGNSYHFTLQYSNSYSDRKPPLVSAEAAQRHTTRFWRKWIAQSKYRGPFRKQVERSLVTLKALTYAPSGGLVAAPTTSLPEKIGGIRNWDYRFCWLRDSTFSLQGLMECGFVDEARAWLGWLGRSIQGDPSQLKTMYSVTGKREHGDWVAEWLPGYAGSKPVRIGNNASSQFQLDTYGETLDSLYRARRAGLYPLKDKSGSGLEVPLLKHLQQIWRDPDEGLWEFRSGPQQFTHSKVMAWVAFDRGIRMADEFGIEAPVARWRKIRKQIHDEVCAKGFHKKMNSFTQTYGQPHVDASLLLMPIVGFLPINDERILGTVRAIEKNLMRAGFLHRYDAKRKIDGLPSGEAPFLACNFWLIDIYVLQGRFNEARCHFEKLLAVANDVGLLSEQYDDRDGLLGNFPQAWSHIGLINAALSLKAGTSVRLRALANDSTSKRAQPKGLPTRRK
jgi:GH15 family glucan-1,4-alpha-glucosidase